MIYLQRGIRWIPEYRVEIDGKGEARVKLQATLINETGRPGGRHGQPGDGRADVRHCQDMVDPMSLAAGGGAAVAALRPGGSHGTTASATR